MTRLKQAILGTTLIVASGFGLAAQAGSQADDAAEMQQFLASSQSLTQAITAAETAVGGKAMDAGWEGDKTTAGGYEVVVAKPDGTLARAIVAADGTVQVTAMAEGDDHHGGNSDEKDGENDSDQDGNKG
ncbi:hypothetical protein [Pseudorhodobacter sp.]|uniref:hypothetical protein n=1 Tax=Pseudorhodobacter sp. TaxID=1934400 RepID=UPI00264A0D4B|nr:hypothetical protein [Pseudorhodobacter sp.]MDN5787084.1 hypothetical protein [Pseudorhodobacter sp.]